MTFIATHAPPEPAKVEEARKSFLSHLFLGFPRASKKSSQVTYKLKIEDQRFSFPASALRLGKIFINGSSGLVDTKANHFCSLYFSLITNGTMGFFNQLKAKAIEAAKEKILEELGVDAGAGGGGGGDDAKPTMTTEEFEKVKPEELRKDIRMISGCQDRQTSADVSNVSCFQLPDPAGRAGGACTSTLLNILYADEREPEDDLSFTEVLEKMRVSLKRGGYSQIPQLTSMNPIDVNTKFDLVPDTATGTKRAVMIGINYVGDKPGELSGW